MEKTKLELADIEGMIESETSMKMGAKTTVLLATLKNGFEVIATSGCVDPANYNHELGVATARKRLIDKIWELEGYNLQTKLAAR